MARLDELGVLVVAAAGNEGTDEPRYPAADPTLIGAGAADRERRADARSNRALSAEIYAPGVEILSACPAMPSHSAAARASPPPRLRRARAARQRGGLTSRASVAPASPPRFRPSW
jgi:subtilisin family serine protease